MTTVDSKPDSVETTPTGDGSARGGRRKRVLVGGAVVLAIGAAAGGGVYLWQSHDKVAASSNTTTVLPTAEVIRTNIVSTANEDGTLGYGDSRGVLGGGTGRVTWLPTAGAVLERGNRAYGVDGHNVPLLYGSTPFWRSLQSGMKDGYDVLELETNLHALGYGSGLTVDRSFTAATTKAIKKWQKANSMAQTGVVQPGDAVLEPGAVRVAKVDALLSSPAAGIVYTVTGTQRLVSASLTVSDAQTLARKGAKVQVTLPGGKKVTGTITSIGSVATADSGGASGSASQTGESTENAKITVTVTLPAASAASALDGAPVTIGFTSAEHKNVLAVPINSLLASSDNSYSVKVVDSSGSVRSVPVKLGIFDGDNVEVTGALSAGEKVQVPQS